MLLFAHHITHYSCLFAGCCCCRCSFFSSFSSLQIFFFLFMFSSLYKFLLNTCDINPLHQWQLWQQWHQQSQNRHQNQQHLQPLNGFRCLQKMHSNRMIMKIAGVGKSQKQKKNKNKKTLKRKFFLFRLSSYFCRKTKRNEMK